NLWELVRSTNQPQTSYAVAASLSEFELKKILIDKMETNKSINRSDIQKNLYNALFEAYNSNKDMITSYGDEPKFEAAGTEMQQDQGNESGHIDDQPNNKADPKHDYTIAKARKPSRTFEEIMGTPIDFSAYVMNRLKIDNLTQEILVGPVPADDFINNDLEYLKGGSLSSKYVTSTTRNKAAKDDNVLYKFKEGDFPRLNLRDIEDMLFLLVEKKLSNLDVDDRYDLERFNTIARNPVKEILLKLNLPDHRSLAYCRRVSSLNKQEKPDGSKVKLVRGGAKVSALTVKKYTSVNSSM
nr:hypothetical protein [Tanacetum cinerariifolium]